MKVVTPNLNNIFYFYSVVSLISTYMHRWCLLWRETVAIPAGQPSVHHVSTAGLAEMMVQVFTFEGYNLSSSSFPSSLHFAE